MLSFFLLKPKEWSLLLFSVQKKEFEWSSCFVLQEFVFQSGRHALPYKNLCFRVVVMLCPTRILYLEWSPCFSSKNFVFGVVVMLFGGFSEELTMSGVESESRR